MRTGLKIFTVLIVHMVSAKFERVHFSTWNSCRRDTSDNIITSGAKWQWRVNGGRCGVCGDVWNGTGNNADKGRYDTGIIVRSYKDGHYINITFEVSSNYLGYVEFRLCPRNTTEIPLDQTCFDRYPLWIDESHGTRYYIGSRGGIYDIHIRLPSGLVCKKCVLQWKYKTGYRYNGEEQCKCLGCGQQEQYVNCADIEIRPREGWQNQTTSAPRDTHHLVPSSMTSHQLNAFHQSGRQSHSPFWPANNSVGAVPVSEVIAKPPFRLVDTTTPTSTIITKNVTSDPRSNMLDNTSSPVQSSTPFKSQGKYSSLQSSTARVVSSLDRIDILTTTPTTPSSSVYIPATTKSGVRSNKRSPNQVWTVEEIRKEIVRNFGSPGGASGVKVLFSPPAPSVAPISQGVSPVPILRTVLPSPKAIGHHFLPRLARVPSVTEFPVRTDVPNTQFVSVSNILYRFLPNFIPPFSLARPSTSGLILPPGCDVTSDEFRCRARDIYHHSPGVSRWCEVNCRVSNCVPFMCDCGCEDISKTPVTNSSCHAIAEFQGVESMDEWCRANCKVGYCPANTCSIEDCLAV